MMRRDFLKYTALLLPYMKDVKIKDLESVLNNKSLILEECTDSNYILGSTWVFISKIAEQKAVYLVDKENFIQIKLNSEQNVEYNSSSLSFILNKVYFRFKVI